jgi:YbbR domain-containing protein
MKKGERPSKDFNNVALCFRIALQPTKTPNDFDTLLNYDCDLYDLHQVCMTINVTCEPPSSSLATGLAQKDQSFTCFLV